MQLFQLVHLDLLSRPSNDQPLLRIWFRYDMKMNMVDFLFCDPSVVLLLSVSSFLNIPLFKRGENSPEGYCSPQIPTPMLFSSRSEGHQRGIRQEAHAAFAHDLRIQVRGTNVPYPHQ